MCLYLGLIECIYEVIIIYVQIVELMVKGLVVEGNSKNGKRNEKGGKFVKLFLFFGEFNLVILFMEFEYVNVIY